MNTDTQTVTITIPRPHPKQRELLNNRKRFNVLKCGRRFGKTELCQYLINEIIPQRGIIGYWSPTYKALHEVWKETKRNFYEAIQSSNEQVKQIILLNGTTIDFWSMDDPNAGRGRKYHRALVDECEMARNFEEAWEQTIRPTLTDFEGDAYLLSTPQFGETYFKQVCLHENQFPDWKTFVYTTYDNPFIKPEEIEQSRQLLHPAVFSCEYLAEDVDGKTLNPFAHQWDDAIHTGLEAVLNYHKQLYISIDFNLNPFAVTFWHYWQDHSGYHLHGIDEAEISQGSIPAMIELIRSRYGGQLHSCIVTGDAMGNQGNIARIDNASHYIEIARGLGLGEHQIKVPANPTHENSRADVNKVLWECKRPQPRFFVKLNPTRMKNTIRDFKVVQCDATGAIVKGKRSDLTQRADYMDTSRYIFNLVFKPILSRLRAA